MPSKEENAVILDFLPNGYPSDSRPSYRRQAIAQALGTSHFSLLEVIPKKDIFLKSGDIVYIGDGKRDQVHHVEGKIPFSRLTGTASSELDSAIGKLIDENEKRLMAFFNNAQPITIRMHQLELLPGLGKKHMQEILLQREDKPFESFEDIRKRVHLMPDPKKLILRRILEELQEKDKHKIFTD